MKYEKLISQLESANKEISENVSLLAKKIQNKDGDIEQLRNEMFDNMEISGLIIQLERRINRV